MNNPMAIIQMLQQVKANPVGFFMQRGMNIPADMVNDPNAILQHLVNSGRVTQQQINNAYQMAQMFK